MKRFGNLYQNIYKFENIKKIIAEVCKNTKNKRKVNKFKECKCINLYKIYHTLETRSYVPGKYHVFTIYEPKKRRIVSQNMFDKVVNHLVARYILMPTISKCLIDANVASRPQKGTSAGLKYYYNFRRCCDIKYGKYYILKCDIKKFFQSINHDLLKRKLERRIKDKEALKIVFDIIDSEKYGLGIGNMTSQILAIFYLNDLDHFIKEELKIKYYVRYQDDFLLFHDSKDYLKECLKRINDFVANEKLELNSKTRIYSNKENLIFLGRDKYGRYARRRTIGRKIKKRMYLYKNGDTDLISLIGSIRNFRNVSKNVSLKSLN